MKSTEYKPIEVILGGDKNKDNYILKMFEDICNSSSKLTKRMI